MNNNSTEESAMNLIWIIFVLLTAAAINDIFYILYGLYILVSDLEIFGSFYGLSSIWQGMLLYWQFTILPFIIFILYFFWKEIDNNDDFSVPSDLKLDSYLFNMPLQKSILANFIIPIICCVFILTARLGETISRQMALILLSSFQLILYLLFCLEFKSTLKNYKKKTK